MQYRNENGVVRYYPNGVRSEVKAAEEPAKVVAQPKKNKTKKRKKC